MIRFLEGQVKYKDQSSIILLTNGVGYLVKLPAHHLNEINEGQDLELFIYSQIREDAFNLFGFTNQNDLRFFEQLIAINGVGPKVGLALLDLPVPELQNAILTENIPLITKAKGVGKKLAERLCLELKGKIEITDLAQLEQINSSQGGAHSNLQEQELDDAIITLETLGYKRKHIQSVFTKFPDEATSAEDLVELFLKNA